MSKTITSKINGLYAFWRYDMFPFTLGGPVDEMSPKGSVQTTNFGYGYWFHPIKLMPLRDGIVLHAKLDKLEQEHRAAQKKFDDEWRAKVEALLPEVTRKT